MGFQQGLSGLNSTAKNLEIIGNNIANSNTYGAKYSRAEFADMYAAALNGAGGGNGIGIGTTLAAVSQQFTQGNITATGNAMDMSLNGSGFFQLTDGVSPTVYSRNGQFKIDREGFIVNNDHLMLMGYPANGQGVIQPGAARPLQLPTAGIEPNKTTKVSIELNLDSRAGVTSPGAGAARQIDFNDSKTYNNATSLTVYDAKGQEVAMTYYFQKTGNDQWNVFATANGTPVNGTTAEPLPLTPEPIDFLADGSGPLTALNALAVSIAGPLTNSEGALIVTPLDFTLSLDGATQYGAGFGVTDLQQDGYSPGQLSSIAIENDGIVLARYSNGQSKPCGQVELANFRNAQGLQAKGGNVWSSTYASGEPVVGTPGQGSLGVLQSGALEESNIDLTGELVNMITSQRIYQANAQTIKTEDQVLQTLVNLR
jgi:flagellar hook protein FlgE